MDKADGYLKRAAECLELAKRARTPDEKTKLIEIAQAWRELAENGNTSMPSDSVP